MSMPAARAQGLALTQVTASYKSRTVLRGVSLTVRRGEVVAISGGNGSGKTTTLAVAAGLLAPRSGSVTWSGIPVSLSDRPQRRDVGLSLGRPPVDPTITVGSILEMHAGIYRQPAGDANRRALLDDLGLVEHSAVATSALSAGYRQRLAFALASVHRPSLLLLDEPLATVDTAAEAVIRAEVARAAHAGAAVVFASHETDGVLESDRTVRLLDGELVSASDSTTIVLEVGVPNADGPSHERPTVGHMPDRLVQALTELPGVGAVHASGPTATIHVDSSSRVADRRLRLRISQTVAEHGGIVTELRASTEGQGRPGAS